MVSFCVFIVNLLYLTCLLTVTCLDPSSTLQRKTYKEKVTKKIISGNHLSKQSKRDTYIPPPDVYTIRQVPENKPTTKTKTEMIVVTEEKAKTESMTSNDLKVRSTPVLTENKEVQGAMKTESSTGNITPISTNPTRVNLVTACNSVLAVISLIINILIVFYYNSSKTTLSSVLYLRNGVCDIVSALGFLLQVPSVVTIYNIDSSVTLPLISNWVVTVAVRMSVFMNCVLGVVRCINILNPFYPVNRKIVTFSTVLYCILWSSIASLDLWFYTTKIGLQNKVYLVKSLVLKPEPGFSISSVITGLEGAKVTSLSQAEVVIAQFLTPIAIPALLCFALMIFQIFHLRQGRIGVTTEKKKTERAEEISMADKEIRKRNNNQKAAMTIFLVTTVYVLTSTLSILVWLVIYRDHLGEREKIKILSWEELSWVFLSSTTLPLLCSTLTPLTLLLRSSAMQRYLRDIFKPNCATRE
ncbi:hypothetical protein ACHWQZ_G017702 [Mnemiopsis leidyi]